MTASSKSASRALLRYRGNYDDYLVQRAAAEEQQLAAYKNQQREIAQLQEFVDRFRAKNTQGRPGPKQAQADRAHGEDRSPGQRRQENQFPFPAAAAQRPKVITLEGIHHAYGDERGLSRH